MRWRVMGSQGRLVRIDRDTPRRWTILSTRATSKLHAISLDALPIVGTEAGGESGRFNIEENYVIGSRYAPPRRETGGN